MDLPRLIRYYDQRYATPPGAMRDYDLYVRIANAQPGERILDIGCGEGFLLASANRADMAAVGVEISELALRLAARHAPAAHLVCSAGEALPFPDRSFDLVTCIGTLEHFTDPAQGAREVARILRPRGRALLVVPNRRFAVWLFSHRRGTEQSEATELLLDLREWQALFLKCGLETTAAAKEPWYTKPTRSLPRRLALRLGWRLLPLRWTYQFAFLCSRV